MVASVNILLSAFIDEMGQTNRRYVPFIQKAEKEGYPYLAKLFRAVIASEEARTNLFRTTMANHAGEAHDYYICPHCGLVFVPDAPDKCPVDETLGIQFEKIS
jgi:rubrerythrin